MEKPSNSQTSELPGRLTENTEASMQSLRLRTRRFFKREGRRPRVLVSGVQRQNGTYPAEQLVALLAEIGCAAVLHPVLKCSDNLARIAVDSDVHALVILGVDNAKQMILQDVTRTLEAYGGEDILLALDDSGICDILRQSSHPVVWFQNASMDSVARLLDALERIH